MRAKSFIKPVFALHKFCRFAKPSFFLHLGFKKYTRTLMQGVYSYGHPFKLVFMVHQCLNGHLSTSPLTAFQYPASLRFTERPQYCTYHGTVFMIAPKPSPLLVHLPGTDSQIRLATRTPPKLLSGAV